VKKTLQTAAIGVGILQMAAFGAEQKNLNDPMFGWFWASEDSFKKNELPKTGVDFIVTMSAGFDSTPAEHQLDLGKLDEQIRFAREHGLRMVLHVGAGPVHAQAWLNNKIHKAGESSLNAWGQPNPLASIHSPVLKKTQSWLISNVISYLAKNDPQHTVWALNPGAEWWFPMDSRYNPADISDFRKWLEARYRTIEKLNEAWESNYVAFDSVEPPRLDIRGGGKGSERMGRIIDADLGEQIMSWNSKQFPISEGKKYVCSYDVRLQNGSGAGALVRILYFNDKGGSIAMPTVDVQAGNDWSHVEEVLETFRGTVKAQIQLTLEGGGKAEFSNVSLCEAGTNTNILPQISSNPEQGEWTKVSSGGGNTTLEIEKVGGPGKNSETMVLSATVHPAKVARNQYQATYDWSVYWEDKAAGYIDELASRFKIADPSRPTIAYLTMSFAQPAEWDLVQSHSILPDAVGRTSKNLDIIALQIVGADGDAYRIDSTLDVMRKYNKPLWISDLVDFTSGVHIGPDANRALFHHAIQHGATGFFPFGWYQSQIMDYSYAAEFSIEEMKRMFDEVKITSKELVGMKPTVEGALVLPYMPATHADTNGAPNDFRSFMGWYKILQRMGVAVDVLTLRDLAENPAETKRYPFILVPDSSRIPMQALEALKNYQKQGGKLLLAGNFAKTDEKGREIPPSSELVPTHDFGLDFTGKVIRDTHAGNTPSLFIWREDSPQTEAAFEKARNWLQTVLPSDGRVANVENSPKDLTWVSFSGPDGRRAMYFIKKSGTKTDGTEVVLPEIPTDDIKIWTDIGGFTSSPPKTKFNLSDFQTASLIEWKITTTK
jgi:hypothetical protein